MSSTPKKIVAVVGSTGTQGGGVARALLKEGTFAVRALTRNVDSKKAQDLKALGAEVVAADLEDVESLKIAFKGAWAVFGVTDFWSLYGIHKGNQREAQAHEEQHGRNLVDAAEAEGVQHFVWSTLPHIEPYLVSHFESKVTVADYLRSKQVPFSLILTSFYYSNLITHGFLRKDGDEFVVELPIPSTSKIASFDPDETGSWVLLALKSEPTGKTYSAYGESLSAQEHADTLSRVSGKTVRVTEVSPEIFNTKEGEDEWWLQFTMKAFHDGLYVQDYRKSREENPNAKTFEEFSRHDAALKALIGY
ncbi:hypothetical protein BS47DRAFT_1347594 [Hydnum rufescens UP504]|uniref:NmrA-like domain-containing protein n=1 Tax=Hydnum rufescens UP504 TaxID=1448309 RepID=A0A9P6ATP8_9AGAM|nr:hypothetical protein BS47DRAFT_1347594 [Hydnum rufescens UP504]